MVDSCFKIFKAKCFRRAIIAESRESVFEDDKNATSDKKQPNFDSSAPSIDNEKKGKAEHTEYKSLLDCEPEVILRRHNRRVIRSISETTSNDAMSSDEEGDDDENLDILYPLPRVSTHERSLIEEGTRTQLVIDKHNDMESAFIYSCL